jgi:hypothetical protein
MLDEYIQNLTEEDEKQKVASAHAQTMSVEELAHTAGIKLAESVCPKCASQMTKSGSLFKCGCGMMKKAGKKKEAFGGITTGSMRGAQLARSSIGRQFGQASRRAAQTADEAAAPLLKGTGGGELTAKELAAAGGGRNMLAKLKAKLTGGGGGALQPALKTASLSKQALLAQSALGGLAGYMAQGDPKKTPKSGFWRGAGGGALGALGGAALGAPAGLGGAIAGSFLGGGLGGYLAGRTAKLSPAEQKDFARKKLIEARMQAEEAKHASVEVKTAAAHDQVEILKFATVVYNGDVDQLMVGLLEDGMDKEAVGALGRMAKGLWSAGKHAIKGNKEMAGRSLTGVKRTFGKSAPGKSLAGVKETYRKARGLGAGGMGPQTKGGLGVGGALLETAKKHPGYAAGALGTGALGAGAVGGAIAGRKKTAAAIEVGDAAGRVLAKIALDATPIPMDELRESLEEAKDREDIQGRGTRGAMIGAGLGGVGGGGAGYGIGRLIGGSKGGLIGAGLGAGLGMYGGAKAGRPYAEEEARADKAISMLRAMRAHKSGAQTGARAGYMAGLRRGYGMNQPQGAPGAAQG